ncbi:hypothetical protein NC652_008274 [Populus alba x Populus x berolinensis]|uniref:Uncharacterized protein n=1 Tax=Populus alba x Populus x berolinensis TaxID=444605 RepID=A0AAD6R5Z1_9ROSI|nr:hypothetical protein NC652_008274 [Populus alba x Populus x berolinensis]KAJ7003015.1 hypothetical protein NC653_008293 [Populus alba x Populus x berolinensis]
MRIQSPNRKRSKAAVTEPPGLFPIVLQLWLQHL